MPIPPPVAYKSIPASAALGGVTICGVCTPYFVYPVTLEDGTEEVCAAGYGCADAATMNVDISVWKTRGIPVQTVDSGYTPVTVPAGWVPPVSKSVSSDGVTTFKWANGASVSTTDPTSYSIYFYFGPTVPAPSA